MVKDAMSLGHNYQTAQLWELSRYNNTINRTIKTLKGMNDLV